MEELRGHPLTPRENVRRAQCVQHRASRQRRSRPVAAMRAGPVGRRQPSAQATLMLLAALSVVLLSACSGPAGPITVHGSVVNMRLQPLPGLEVYLGSAGTPRTTSADGTFTLTNVTAPYDVTVVDPANDTVLMTLGLTRTDPTLQFTTGTGPGRQTDLSGDISGASVGPGQVGAVLIGSEGFARGAGTINSGTAFSGTYEWSGEASLPVTLFGLVADANGSDLPTAFEAYGTRAMTLTDGVPSTGIDVPLMPVTTVHLTGTAHGATGFPLGLLGATYTFRDGSHVASSPPMTWPASSPFDIALPDVPAASATVFSIATTGTGDNFRWRTGLRAADSGIDLTLQAPAALSTPVAGATNVSQQGTFRWSPADASVYLLMVVKNTAGPTVIIATAEPQATLPDLSAFGLSGSLAGADYDWHVITLGQYASIDAAAGPEAMLTNVFRLEAGAGAPAVADGWYVDSPRRSFTFAP